MHTIRTLAVYCASSNQIQPVYFEHARRLGELLAQEHIRVVYGDGGIGLMGALAEGVIGAGGEIVGVIPQFMVDEGWNNPQSTQTVVVASMHERKATIERMADAMVALPGGIGTFEELLECLTWKQLGLHTKPVAILNTDGYFDGLLHCLDIMAEQKFMRETHRRNMFTVVSRPDDVLSALRNAPKWDKSIRRDAAM